MCKRLPLNKLNNMKYNILIIIIILCFCNTAQAQDDDEILKIPKTNTPAKPTTPAPKPATNPKPTSTTTKPTTPVWKKNFEKQFPILKNEERSYLPQTMIEKYTTLLNTLPSAAKTEKELIYARIELLKTKIDKDSDGDGFTDKNDNCPNQYAKNNNGCPRNGYFTVTYTDGDKYEGSFVNDKYEGKGKYTFANGNVYDGDWKDGKRTGKGTMTYSDGKYEGNWKSDIRTGKGKYTWNEGAIYDGEWKEDKITGYGKKTWTNGDEYLGNFLDGYLHGYGVYSSKSGHLNNCPECVKYDGQWINGKKDVMGSCYDKNSIIIYSGKFKDDKPVYTYPMSGLNDFLNDAVKIGTQTWSGKNLDVAYFRNGDPIPEAKTNEEWEKAGENKQPAWCYYKNDPANGKKYGKLYNWYAVNDSRGLAPAGWHIPSEKEWNILIDYLGGESIAGGKLKATTDWNYPNKDVTNSSGFSGLPASFRSAVSNFYYAGFIGVFWSSTVYKTNYAWHLSINYDYPTAIMNYYNDMAEGCSVRCIKD